MKRKDWISLVALLIILGIALIGEQFHANGEWIGGAISLLTKLLPLLVFFIIAVYFRNKKGSYVAWFRRISYISFAISVIFLFVLSMPFMHYFNVTGSQEKIADASRQILDDCDMMFNTYKRDIDSRLNSYQSALENHFKQGHIEYLNDKLGPQLKWDKSSLTGATSKMSESWYTNYEANKDSLNKIRRPEFEQALIQDFDAFSAANELKELITLYNRYKKLLTDEFAQLTPLEEEENYHAEFTYQHHESSWEDSKDIFTRMEFNFLWFLLFLVLALFACSSYIFFKDENVRAPRPRKGSQSIYDQGHNMNNINNVSDID